MVYLVPTVLLCIIYPIPSEDEICCCAWCIYHLTQEILRPGSIWINSLSPERYGNDVKCVILQHILMVYILSILNEIFRWIRTTGIDISWHQAITWTNGDQVLCDHMVLLGSIDLTHRGWVTHICVGKLTIIYSDNDLSPGWRQAITWINAGILLDGL